MRRLMPELITARSLSLPPTPPLRSRSYGAKDRGFSNATYGAGVAHPHPGVDSWEAAWKVRRHWEEVTEKRKALGKPTY